MYRAEFFDYLMVYKDFCVFADDIELGVDCMAWDASTITVYGKLVKTGKGDLVHITRNGTTVYDGVVSALDYPSKGTMTISVKPLQCCFHNDFALNALTLGEIQSTDIAVFVYQWLKSIYIDGIDSYADITRGGGVSLDESPIFPLKITNSCPSASRPFVYTSDFVIKSAQEIFTDALTQYRVMVYAEMDLKGMQVVTDLRIISDAVTIESDLDNCIERSVSIGNSVGGVNKMLIYRTYSGASESQHFYLSPSGKVNDPSDTGRILPVVEKREYLEYSDTWAADALQKAKDTMETDAYDNEIRLTYADDDALVHPDALQIGTLATIYVGGTAYTSLLTGKVRNNHLITLIFGSIRTDLTKQIIMDRRR